MEAVSGANAPHPHPESHEFVTITINGNPHHLHRGRHLVSELKQLGNVPLADVLEQVLKGKLTPLPDDGAVTVQDGDVFISHPRDCQSS